jgi:hypothetical protein
VYTCHGKERRNKWKKQGKRFFSRGVPIGSAHSGGSSFGVVQTIPTDAVVKVDRVCVLGARERLTVYGKTLGGEALRGAWTSQIAVVGNRWGRLDVEHRSVRGRLVDARRSVPMPRNGGVKA